MVLVLGGEVALRTANVFHRLMDQLMSEQATFVRELLVTFVTAQDFARVKNFVEFHPMHGRRGEITSLAGTMEKGLLRVGVRVVEQALQPRSLIAAVVVRALKRGLQEVLLAQMLIQLDLGLGNKVTQGASAWFLCFVAFALFMVFMASTDWFVGDFLRLGGAGC